MDGNASEINRIFWEKNAISDFFSGQLVFSRFLGNGSLEKVQSLRANIFCKVE